MARRASRWASAWLSLCVLPMLLLFSSCSVTKNIPEGEYLLDRVEIACEGNPPDIRRSDFRRYLRQRPNGKVLGGRFHLWLYNLGKRDAEKGFSGWLRRIGEPPVVYSEELTAQSVENIETYLHSRGFYSARVSDSAYSTRAKRMCVRYTVSFGPATLIDTVRFDIADSLVRSLVTGDGSRSVLRPGVRLDGELLTEEAARIERTLRNEGFFNFSSDNVGYLADTLGSPLSASVTLCVPPRGATGRAESAFRQYVVDSVRVFTHYDPMHPATARRDSLRCQEYNGIYFYSPVKPGIRPAVVRDLLLFSPDSLLRASEVNKSQNSLLSLGLYQGASFEFRESTQPPIASPLGGGRLLYPINAGVRLSRFPVQGYSVEALLTTSGELGMQGVFSYKHRNLFRGSEQLEVRFQAQVDAIRNRKEFQFRTALEFGLRVGLRFPRFMIPFMGSGYVSRFSPSTQFVLSYNYQRRPDYTRTLASSNIAYAWNGGPTTSYSVVPVEVSVVKIFSIDDRFAERIRRTYLANSYISQLVSLSSFSFSYAGRATKLHPSTRALRVNFELSGNALWGLSKWTKRATSDGMYKFFDLPFSQFVRADVNYVYNWVLDKSNTMAFRVFVGAGYPYGNSRALPFGKKYFEGGANGVRAWHACDLGPGSYHEEGFAFPNQSGDMKLELNWEYRFKLFWKLEGAFFVDAGNIWAITGNDEREGATFSPGRFYREIAMGWGTGLRLNLGFFVMRADLGIKLYDPARRAANESFGTWIPDERQYGDRDFVVHFGVGYPF